MNEVLNEELHRLQIKYRAGFDIVCVEWHPKEPKYQPSVSFDENLKAKAERVPDPVNMSRWIIVVYEKDCLDDALHCVHHEFIEHIIMKPAKTFVELSNVLLKLLNTLQYEGQEDVVETFAVMEDKEYEEIRKTQRRNSKA